MSANARNGGSSSGKKELLLNPGGLITYKRRKRAAQGVLVALQGELIVSTALEQSMNEPLCTMLCNGSYEPCGISRLEHNWRNVLEHLLQSQGVSDGGGSWSCIHKALASGILGFSGKLNMHAAQSKDSYKDCCEFEVEAARLKSSRGAGKKQKEPGLDGSQKYTNYEEDARVITKKCQDVLYDIFISENFASFCDSLCRNFQGSEAYRIIDLSLVELRMKSGVYEQSPGLFDQDIKKVWEKIQKSCQEIALHASSLSRISQASCKNLLGKDSLPAIGEWENEGTIRVGTEEKNSMDSHTSAQFPSYESDRSTKPDETAASCLYKVCACKQCGTEADGKHSLICDGCEAVYHVPCIKPAVQGIPKQSWYCTGCSTNKTDLAEPELTCTQENSLHENCTVCDRLKSVGIQECLNNSNEETVIVNGSRESSVSSMVSDESLEESMAVIPLVCKQCGTGENEAKRFLICENAHCFYKYYHIRCLKSTQLASQQQKHQHCWYCPSCLCRTCLCDRDDDKIVLCDGCDEGYHTYCMKPPLTTIPEGKWYCVPCNAAKARQGMQRYEQWVLQQHGKDNMKFANGTNRSIDILVSAAEKLTSEERLAVVKKGR